MTKPINKTELRESEILENRGLLFLMLLMANGMLVIDQAFDPTDLFLKALVFNLVAYFIYKFLRHD